MGNYATCLGLGLAAFASKSTVVGKNLRVWGASRAARGVNASRG
jgi:hypothetical protein